MFCKEMCKECMCVEGSLQCQSFVRLRGKAVTLSFPHLQIQVYL